MSKAASKNSKRFKASLDAIENVNLEIILRFLCRFFRSSSQIPPKNTFSEQKRGKSRAGVGGPAFLLCPPPPCVRACSWLTCVVESEILHARGDATHNGVLVYNGYCFSQVPLTFKFSSAPPSWIFLNCPKHN